MGAQIQPQFIRETREAFGLSSSQFAAALGVHPTTVSRWENAPGPVSVEGTAWTVLMSLRQRLESNRRAKAEAARVGEEVAQALLIGGTIVALALLVAYAADRT